MKLEKINWPPPEYKEIVERKLVHYLRTDGRLSLPEGDGSIQQLETAYAKWFKVPYALTFNSGTSALHSAYVAIGLEEGDEILAPVYTFHSTVTPLLHMGVKPILCESELKTGNIDPKDALNRITKRTRAIVVTHMYGYPANMNEICRLAKQYKLRIVEDCSHAHGASYYGKSVGSIGDVGVFSLQENKLAPAGEGGILVTSSVDIYERALVMGNFGKRLLNLRTPSYRRISETGFGLKYRMHPLAALSGLAGIDIAMQYSQQRRDHAKKVAEALTKTSVVSLYYCHEAAYFAFRLRYNSEAFGNVPINDFIALARKEGLDLRMASLRPLSDLPLFSGEGATFRKSVGTWWPQYTSGDFPSTYKYTSCLLGMPAFWHPSHNTARDEFIEKLINIKK
jgi:perosamine synthetase